MPVDDGLVYYKVPTVKPAGIAGQTTDTVDYDGSVYLLTQTGNGAPFSLWTWNPVTDVWAQPTIPAPPAGETGAATDVTWTQYRSNVVRMDQSVYMVSFEQTGTFASDDKSFLYELNLDTLVWTKHPPMPVARRGGRLGVLAGRLHFLLGGTRFGAPVLGHEEWVGGSWVSRGDLPVDGLGYSVFFSTCNPVAVGTKMYVLHPWYGVPGNSTRSDDMLEYDGDTQTWATITGPGWRTRGVASATVKGADIIMAGGGPGDGGTELGITQVWNQTTNTWSYFDFPYYGTVTGTVTVNNSVYFVDANLSGVVGDTRFGLLTMVPRPSSTSKSSTDMTFTGLSGDDVGYNPDVTRLWCEPVTGHEPVVQFDVTVGLPIPGGTLPRHATLHSYWKVHAQLVGDPDYTGAVVAWAWTSPQTYTTAADGYRLLPILQLRRGPDLVVTSRRARLYPRDDIGRLYPTPTAVTTPGRLHPGYQ